MSKKLIITAEIQNWNKIYEFITKYFQKKGLSKKNVFAMLISSEEIFSNILHHSCTDCGDEITVLATHRPLEKTMSVVFKYGGVEFNPLNAQLPDVRLPLHKRKLGGLGLLIVNKFTDNINYTYTNGKNVLEILKKIVDY